MPALARDFLIPLWKAFEPLIPERIDTHPYGGHRPRISDRTIFECLVSIVVEGRSFERASTLEVSATTLRRRRDEWIEAGIFGRLLEIVQAGYDRMIGFDFEDVAVDGCITKAPGGGEVAGRSPVDRAKLGIMRSLMVDGNGAPLVTVIAPANTNDSRLLTPTFEGLRPFTFELPDQMTVHLDAGYDSRKTRAFLDELGCDYMISKKGVKLQVDSRWKVERAHSWFNSFKVLAVCHERRRAVIDAWVQFATTIILIKKLVKEGWARYRWEGRPKRWKSKWGRSLARRIKRKTGN
ncbi:IS5 family transposase [Arthrobacter sp. RCC_34]|uniref:IS5 family transposase n=1 Tax=Arthrobacter sp. RCC_34 TaxID=3239230 RepID=UPI0035246C66